MVERRAKQLDDVFHALSDSTRRAMLRSLAGGTRTVSELAAPFDISLAAASKHVKTLERADLIERTVVGRTHICRLNPMRLSEADDWLRYYEQYWTDRFDALDRVLAEQNAKAESTTEREEKE
jgi:DNA-binding transcriptional ArsR family regulator